MKAETARPVRALSPSTPSADERSPLELRREMSRAVERKRRVADGEVSIDGRRFEVWILGHDDGGISLEAVGELEAGQRRIVIVWKHASVGRWRCGLSFWPPVYDCSHVQALANAGYIPRREISDQGGAH